MRSQKFEPKANFFCLKNVSIGQRAEQTDSANAYHRWGVWGKALATG